LSTATETETTEVGRVPPGPHRLTAREWLDALKRTFKEFLADDAMGLSQQIAYSSLLAFFPSVVLLVGLLGLMNAYDDLQIFLGPVAPEAVIKLIEDIQVSAKDDGASLAAFLFGAAGAIWAASGAMNAIIKSINRAYERTETRPFWKVRLIAIVLVLASGITLAGLLLVIVVGGPLGEAISAKAGLGGAFEWVWNIVRWPVAFLAILMFFALVYYLAPNEDVRNWRWVSPGSLVGGVLWLVLSALFALYTGFSESYNETYGTLAGGIILLLWLNYSAFALLFGAELNAELDRQADIRAAGGPGAGLVKPARRNR
jgi:membrane protein